MLQFDGEKLLPSPLNETSTRLGDARFLVECVPGKVSVAKAEATEAICVLRPGFAFVRGTLELSLRVADIVPNSSARLFLHTKGIGSSSDVEATLQFAAEGTGTRLRWQVEIKHLGGLLKAVPQGLVHAAAQKVIADAWASVEAKFSVAP